MPIYLDNAATSFPKPESVYRAVDHALRQIGGNPGRGGHRMALDAARLLLEVRETLARFFGVVDPANLVFTSGATMALNQALFGLLQPGDLVVTSAIEHNALSRPLHALQERGVRVRKLAGDQTGKIALADLADLAADKPRLIALSHCSNVCGTIQPLAEIGAWCRDNGVLFLVDAAQSAGLLPVDVGQLHIDLLAVAGHKGLMGPAGTGCLYVAPHLQLKPIVFGGTGANSSEPTAPEMLPERFEAGTPNVSGFAGLKAGIEFLSEMGLEAVWQHKQRLLQQLQQGLQSLPRVHQVGELAAEMNCGVVSLDIEGLDAAEAGFVLDHKYGVLCRVGLHCAPDAHRRLGSFPAGTLRVSPGLFSTADDMDCLLNALQDLQKL